MRRKKRHQTDHNKNKNDDKKGKEIYTKKNRSNDSMLLPLITMERKLLPRDEKTIRLKSFIPLYNEYARKIITTNR